MRSVRVPKYSLHRASGQARVYIDGRDHYLGPYDSPESHALYRELIDRWQLRRRSRVRVSLTVGELGLLYEQFAVGYYVKGGRPTTEAGLVKTALLPLVRRFGRSMVADFGPRNLKAVREDFVSEGLLRRTVNAQIGRIRRMFRWAVEEELCPPDVVQALDAVAGLRKGRTAAPDAPPVRPVAESVVNQTLPKMPPVIRDMVRLQLLTGARPSEILSLRPSEVSRTGDVWEYVPSGHKTEHHGQSRRIYFGPRAQAILSPYLDNRPADAPCFSPIEAEQERRAARHEARKTPLSCGNRPGTNKKPERRYPLGEVYTVASYRHAIHRACLAAGVPKWSPNRLRHSRATDLRRAFGIEAAQTVLGHANLPTTEIYAEANFAEARRIMAEVG